MDIKNLLKLMVEKGISDVHFKADASPSVRVHGKLINAASIQKLSAADIRQIASHLLSPEQAQAFEKESEMDFAYNLDGVSRFRVNLYRQRSTLALSLRVVPLRIRSFEELNLPRPALERLAAEARGLILFAGVTGAGKTTTLNSFLHYLNQNQAYRIVTVEDPIEFYHQDARSSIVQREVGQDTRSFASALRYVLRQDPDVVVIGEMRDGETMQAALTAAETGHLVLSTIHTMDAAKTIDRILDSVPVQHAGTTRQQLAGALKGIVAQRLIPAKDGRGRYPATEILIVNNLIRRHIAEGKGAELYKAMEDGAYYGMHSFDMDLLRLLSEGRIEQREALENATNPEDVALKIRGAGGAVAG